MDFEEALKIFVEAVKVGVVTMDSQMGQKIGSQVVVSAYFVTAVELAPTEEESEDCVKEILHSRVSQYLEYQYGNQERPEWLKK